MPKFGKRVNGSERINPEIPSLKTPNRDHPDVPKKVPQAYELGEGGSRDIYTCTVCLWKSESKRQKIPKK